MKKLIKKSEPILGLGESIIVLAIILGILGFLIIGQHQEPQAPLLIAFVVLMVYGRLRGFTWDTIIDGMRTGLRTGVDPLVIFLTIGVLIATWIFSGTIPTVMFWGFKIISIQFFLPTVFLVCTLVGIACGSSFTSVSTMGIAFIGIGTTLHFSPGLTAGAIVSGAFCGSNISPLSGTTNLAASTGEIDIYTHIKSLLWTDLPAWFISLIFFTLMGLHPKPASLHAINVMLDQLQNNFWISPWTMLPVILLIILAIFKVPAIPSLGLGALSAVILGWIHNPNISINSITELIMNGFVAHTPNKNINLLLSKGGISSMLTSLALIIFALALGGLLIKFNIIGVIITKIEESVKGIVGLTISAALTCIGVNLLVGEHYLAIILPGESFKEAFDHHNLPRTALTRVLNDAGAAINAVVPWSVSGVFIAGTLRVNPLDFIPFAIFPFLVTVLCILAGFVNVVKKKA
ncbi:Na+/H+ antiporter NhaC [Ligilactobacillus salivarius]|uniref:Na+/H+ antiporter NhaC n=2 Tax=Ligilactobacillus salivarius TaxID=1624 RepID=C2EFK5_9LACO|nr:Na+/H+ antiporter NhaC [Ligilactobacillus salivarius]ATP38040.1 Na+/H+ antiporter NhaC [Ligilactobacillus salivarius]EEJ74758.1 Na+/H+ antiporter NhaC [Ligilactobacillus salivarius DSM 20555 = ATCC 11741]KRM70063.1 Na(+) H(+) antiporter [Ligilactobacillus salivarius DSM 20555 = ATCC 11741]MBE7937179.1 Na+/H+ antiporter NhaC [Ligilactobacillus salivarius]MDG9755685.1 Na+/H+ antiporter NhaC [Ligilactobacillus salivarius]